MNRRQVNFNSFFEAKVQALALADFYPNGRWCVYETETGYRVAFDECKTRDGVDESEILFQAHSNCNSGTREYVECRNSAEQRLMMMEH